MDIRMTCPCPSCVRQATQSVRDWPIALVTCPNDLGRETYNAWASRVAPLLDPGPLPMFWGDRERSEANRERPPSPFEVWYFREFGGGRQTQW